MAIVDRTTFKHFPEEDAGITVREALRLINDSPFFDEIIDEFNIDEIENEFIEVPGGRTLVTSILNMESKVKKIDVKCKLNKVHCKKFTEEGQAILELAEVKNEELIKLAKTDLVDVETTYSVRSDYFNGLYDIDKYLSFLLNRDYQEIIDTNIEMLERRTADDDSERNFRLVYDEDGKLFARAMTSTERYKDYNIAFSVFVTLIQLHELFKTNEESFEISEFTHTESEIKVIFKNNRSYEFIDKSRISFSLVLTNDEIKREAVRLTGLFSISFGNDKDVYVKPEEGESGILSFTHSLNPSTVKERLASLNMLIKDFIKNTIDDFDLVKKVKNFDTLRDFLLMRAKNSKDKEFKQYKSQVVKILSNRVDTIFQLLDIVRSVDELIQDEHIQAKEYWRYKLYQALIEEPKKRKNN